MQSGSLAKALLCSNCDSLAAERAFGTHTAQAALRMRRANQFPPFALNSNALMANPDPDRPDRIEREASKCLLKPQNNHPNRPSKQLSIGRFVGQTNKTLFGFCFGFGAAQVGQTDCLVVILGRVARKKRALDRPLSFSLSLVWETLCREPARFAAAKAERLIIGSRLFRCQQSFIPLRVSRSIILSEKEFVQRESGFADSQLADQLLKRSQFSASNPLALSAKRLTFGLAGDTQIGRKCLGELLYSGSGFVSGSSSARRPSSGVRGLQFGPINQTNTARCHLLFSSGRHCSRGLPVGGRSVEAFATAKPAELHFRRLRCLQ